LSFGVLQGMHAPGELWLQPKRYSPAPQLSMHDTHEFVAAR
jgi:hypothetical protein